MSMPIYASSTEYHYFSLREVRRKKIEAWALSHRFLCAVQACDALAQLAGDTRARMDATLCAPTRPTSR